MPRRPRYTPDDALRGAMGKLDEAVIVGFDHTGGLYVVGTVGAGETFLLFEMAKSQTLEACFDGIAARQAREANAD